jgi:5-bromo-4-chloroindolyl phosphate hydrolysis protein
MNKDDFKTLGKEFREMIRDFTNTGDLNKVSNEVENTVNSALDRAFREVENALASIKMGQYFQNKGATNYKYQHKYKQEHQDQSQSETLNQDRHKYKYQYHPRAKRRNEVMPTNFSYKAVGSASGILLTVFGGVLTGSMLISILGTLVTDGFFLEGLIPLSVLLILSLGMTARGTAIRRRLKRFRAYLRIINNRSTCLIEELSDNSGYSKKYIVKDLQRMIAGGMLPEARLDSDKTFVMLNRESYQLYLEHKEELDKRRNEERQRSERKNGGTADAKAEGEDFVGRTAIEEAKSNIRSIREAKQGIASIEVSAKIQRIEEITSLIIEYVEKHPKKIGEVRRLFGYYLPTTIKLIDAYLEFDRQTVQGENIINAKQEIKDALDTIIHAFENLLDGLFENAALDVSADISVLRTILAQDGLTQNDFD